LRERAATAKEDPRLASAITKSDFSIPQATLQRRLFAAERKLLVLIGTLPPLIPGLEDKYALAAMAYEDATHADALRQRIGQLRGPGKREPSLEPRLDAIFEAALRAPSLAALLYGIFGVLKRDLVRAYEGYLVNTHPLGDLPSRVLLEAVLEQEHDAVRAGESMADRLSESVSDHEWADYLLTRLRAAGGVDGLLEGRAAREESDAPESRPFQMPLLPNWGDFPIRFQNGEGGPDEDLHGYAFTAETDLRVVRAGIYNWLFHESDVLDYLPRLFYETQGMPFDFQLDLARHLWDEARHSEAGYRGLRRIGFDPYDSEHPVGFRLGTARMNPVELYAVMTQGFEAGSFPIKATILTRLDELGDPDLSSFLRYDRADETIHVSFGHKWVPVLAQHFGDDRPLKEIVADSIRLFTEEIDRNRNECPIERTLPPDRRLSYNKVARFYGLPSLN
jgi:hypothetical protein